MSNFDDIFESVPQTDEFDKEAWAAKKKAERDEVYALNEMRNDLLEEERPTDIVDEVLLKVIDAPAKKVRCRNDEARE